MRYIVDFISLSCIPRTDLKHLFTVIVFTDNCKDFPAKEVIKLLKTICLSIVTLTGCAQNPNKQGSVQNQYHTLKWIINIIKEKDRQQGNVNNWTNILGNSRQHRR
jgi:hypothetical protein